MPTREQLIEQYGGIEKVPDYIRDFFEERDEKLHYQNVVAPREAEEKKERERERIKSLRRPPACVWRVGSTVFWEPPETIDDLQPAGFWISEERNGSWTSHGDYLLPHFRSAQLFGNGAAQVEAYYNDTALGEVYISGPVEAPADEDPYLVNKVRYYVTQHDRPPIYYERWRRVLAGFGVAQPKSVRGVQVEPLAPAMTAREAQGYADRGWERWVPVAAALRRVEETRQ